MLQVYQPRRGTIDSSLDPRKSGRAPLVLLLASLATGIAVDRAAPLPFGVSLFGAFVCLLGCWVLLNCQRARGASVALLISVALTGASWHHAWWRLYPSDEIALAVGEMSQPVVVEVVARHAPRHIPAPPHDPLRLLPIDERSRMDVTIVRLRNGSRWEPASGNSLVIVDGTVRGVAAGDRLRVAGHLSTPPLPANPGDVDFRAFVRRERRLTMLRVESPLAVMRLQAGSRWQLRRLLDWLRQRGDALLWRHVEHRRAGLAAALLLGAREQLDDERTAAFVRTNTMHLLAISGMHIAILAACLFQALKLGLLQRWLALTAVACATVLYTIVTDADPSAVRAMILVLLVCLAMSIGRRWDVFNGWGAGGLVVLALNPTDLFSPGPQLSFLAVAVMAWFCSRWWRAKSSDPLDELIAQTRPWPQRAARGIARWQLRMTLMTVCIWLVTMPIVGSQFHAVAPAAILLSMALSAPVSFALMSGFGVMILGAIWSPLGTACGAVCDASLWLIDTVVLWCARLPGSHFWIAGVPDWWSLGLYALLTLLVLSPRLDWRAWVGGIVVWSMAGLAPWHEASDSASPLRCTFLSVGHGAGVVIELPDGHCVLYDAGRLGSPQVGARSIAGYLWSRRIRRLDAVIISHADLDHYNGLPQLLEQFDVKRVYVSPRMFREQVEPLVALRQAVDRSNAELIEISAGGQIDLARRCKLRLLHPPSSGVPGNDNANSLVLAIEYAGRRVLLPGDLEAAGMASLLTQPALDCDLVMAPHHGSPRSNPPGFIAWCRPEWVVISGGHAGKAGTNLVAAYQSAGAAVLNTAHDGAVQFSLSKSRIEATRWNNGRWQRLALKQHRASSHSQSRTH